MNIKMFEEIFSDFSNEVNSNLGYKLKMALIKVKLSRYKECLLYKENKMLVR